MKRHYRRGLAGLLALVMTVCLLPATAWAAKAASGTCGDNLTWTLDDAGTLTISGTGEIEAPEAWSRVRSNIKSVIIEAGVTSIGWYAFYDCSSMTSITIPDSVTVIGLGAFRNCRSLSIITIPDSVTRIGAGAFLGCTGLTSITIPDGVTQLVEVFSGCTGLTSITIPNSVTIIERTVFEDCANLTIYGDAGSAAQRAANECGIPFVPFLQLKMVC